MTNRQKAKSILLVLLEKYDTLINDEEYERAKKIEALICKLIDYINK